MNALLARRCIHGDRITLAFVRLAAGCVVPEHHHEAEQFTYAVSGSLRFAIEGEELVLRAGELVEIPSNVSHSARAEEEFVGIDVFSPIRADWRDATDDYLRRK